MLAFLGSGRHSGLLIELLVVPVVLYQAVQVLRYRRHSERFPRHLFALAVAFVVALEIAAVHVYLHVSSRERADYIASAILDYRAIHRRYPADLAELADPKALPPASLMLGYSAQEPPSLFYAVTYLPFAVWVFDFKQRTWEGPVD